MNNDPAPDPQPDRPETLQHQPVVRFEPPPEHADPMLALVERAARDPAIDVAKMERLLDMAEKVHARKAEAEYDAAMNAAQGEMRPVANDSDNPQTRSRYASYGALDKALRPIYTAHGFSLSFGTASPGVDRVTVKCRISHCGGHTERVEIDMPADGKGAKGGDVMTKTHATGSAVSYGMRYLLKMIFNVATGEYDDDGNAAGGPAAGWRPPSQPPRPYAPPRQGPTPTPQKASSAPVKGKEAAAWFEDFLVGCKKRLLEAAKGANDWGWWKYAADEGWILDTEVLADAPAAVMFKTVVVGNSKEVNITQAKAEFDAHVSAVAAMVDNLPEEDMGIIVANFQQAQAIAAEAAKTAAPAPAPRPVRPAAQPARPMRTAPTRPARTQRDDEAEEEIPEDAQTVEAKIAMVSVKEGSGKKGPWTRYGVKTNEDEWFNTFSNRLGRQAQGCKGRIVTLVYTEDDYGFKLWAIEEQEDVAT